LAFAPWTVVKEMKSGTFTWDADDDHQGQYTLEWLPERDRGAALADLGVADDDF
jgi:hypothetical protein